MVVLTSFVEPAAGIRHRQPHTTVYVNSNHLGKGTLFIAESNLSWIGDSGNGFSIEYPHISLHAISRDLTAFPQECLFLMLDAAVGDEEINEEDVDENDFFEQGTTELRLVPDDKGMLDAMFHAMNACQTLHPDPEDSFSDEDFFEDADEEIPIDETDSRMASLRIENMAGSEGMEEGMGEGRTGVGVGILEDSTAFSGRDYTESNSARGGTVGEGLGSRLGTGVGRTSGSDMAQGDRSFFGNNTLSQNRTAPVPPAHEQSMYLDCSNFDDVEY